MRWGLVAISGLVACKSGQGVDIEVHADDGVTFDSVQLYITYDDCHETNGDPCPSIGWPQIAAPATPAPGDVFVMKGDERLVSGVVENGTGELHLDAAPGFDRPTKIAVVAFNGQTPVAAEVLDDVQIPIGDEAHWYVKLDTVDAASTNVTTGPGTGHDHRAIAWAREPSTTLPNPSGYAGCFAFQQWEGTTWTTQYFVPDTDPDCDGAPADCNPQWNHAPVTSGCLTRWDQRPAVCATGKMTCVDESPGTCSVNTGPVECTPDLLCQCYDPTNPPTRDELQACVRDHLNDAMGGAVPAAYCGFVDNPAMPMYACPASTMRILVPGACASANSGDPTAVLRPITAPFSGNSPTLSVGTAMLSVHASQSNNACVVDLTWLANSQASSGQAIIIAINYGTRQIIVPVYVDFKSSNGTTACTTAPMPCMKFGGWPELGVAGDTMFQCTVQ